MVSVNNAYWCVRKPEHIPRKWCYLIPSIALYVLLSLDTYKSVSERRQGRFKPLKLSKKSRRAIGT